MRYCLAIHFVGGAFECFCHTLSCDPHPIASFAASEVQILVSFQVSQAKVVKLLSLQKHYVHCKYSFNLILHKHIPWSRILHLPAWNWSSRDLINGNLVHIVSIHFYTLLPIFYFPFLLLVVLAFIYFFLNTLILCPVLCTSISRQFPVCDTCLIHSRFRLWSAQLHSVQVSMADQERLLREKSCIYRCFYRVTKRIACLKSYLLYHCCCVVPSCSVPPLDATGNRSFWTRQGGQRVLGRVSKRERVKEGQGRLKTRSRKPEPNIRKILEQRSGSTEVDAIRS